MNVALWAVQGIVARQARLKSRTYRSRNRTSARSPIAPRVVWAALNPNLKSSSPYVSYVSVGWCQCGFDPFPISPQPLILTEADRGNVVFEEP